MVSLGNLKIGTKLLFVLIVNLTLLLALGVAAFTISSSMHDELEQMYGRSFTSATVLLEADRDLHQALVAERSLCFAPPVSEHFTAQLKDYEDNKDQADKRVQRCYEAYPTPETKALVGSYFADREAWDKISLKVVELASAGQAEAAQALSLGASKERYDTMRANLDKLTEIVLNGTKQTVQNSGQAYNLIRTIIICITLGSLLLGAVATLLVSRSITTPLRAMVGFAKRLTAGEYGAELHVRQKDENGMLADTLREMQSSLSASMADARQKGEMAEEKARQATEALAEAEEAKNQADRARAEGMAQAARQLESIVVGVSSASEEMSRQAEEIRSGVRTQGDRISSTATAMEEMNATVLEVARNASDAAAVGDTARITAQRGSRMVEDSIDAINTTQAQAHELKANMDELGRQADSIGQILSVITDIADQTNLLALNAAIEAARAGDAGRGFAVVADEVRKLAEKTMHATKEVGEAIQSIQGVAKANMTSMDKANQELNRAVELANQSSGVLAELVAGVEQSVDRVQSIATAAEEQASTSEEINRAVEEINDIARKTGQGIEESTAALRELTIQMGELSSLVAQLKDETAA